MNAFVCLINKYLKTPNLSPRTGDFITWGGVQSLESPLCICNIFIFITSHKLCFCNFAIDFDLMCGLSTHHIKIAHATCTKTNPPPKKIYIYMIGIATDSLSPA